jgi:hypothetical protein
MPNLNQTGYEDLTVTDTAGGLASVPGGGTSRALIYVGGAPIRFRSDGTAPTATVGMFVPAGNYIDWTADSNGYTSLINKASFIRTTGTSATLRVMYFA